MQLTQSRRIPCVYDNATGSELSVIRILYCAASIDRSLVSRVKALRGAGLVTRVMTPATSQPNPEDLAGLGVETAAWTVDTLLGRGRAIRAAVQEFQPKLLCLDGVKLPWGALLGLDVRVVGLGMAGSTPGSSSARWLVETHPGIAVEPPLSNVIAVPPIWDPHWDPPTDDLSPFGIPAGGFAVGSVATQADYLRWMVEAGHWLPLDLPIHFLIVVPAGARSRLRREVRGTMLPQRYHFSDAVEQAPSLLASCNLSVLSYDEPIQRASTLNAIHYGVPLITLLNGSSAPCVLRAEGAEQLAAEVLNLYEDRDRHAVLADASRELGEQSSDAGAVLARALRAAGE